MLYLPLSNVSFCCPFVVKFVLYMPKDTNLVLDASFCGSVMLVLSGFFIHSRLLPFGTIVRRWQALQKYRCRFTFTIPSLRRRVDRQCGHFNLPPFFHFTISATVSIPNVAQLLHPRNHNSSDFVKYTSPPALSSKAKVWLSYHTFTKHMVTTIQLSHPNSMSHSCFSVTLRFWRCPEAHLRPHGSHSASVAFALLSSLLSGTCLPCWALSASPFLITSFP